MPFTPAQHLRLVLFGVIARVVESCADGDVEAAVQAHPFLAEYVDEIHTRTGETASITAAWWQAVRGWEREALRRQTLLPLAALRLAGITTLELELLLAVGLVEEDSR